MTLPLSLLICNFVPFLNTIKLPMLNHNFYFFLNTMTPSLSQTLQHSGGEALQPLTISQDGIVSISQVIPLL